ncbi:MAG: protein translocase subunit SecF, partial [Candidatus Micrarchaeota archaeon]|nr:protein translocase subunit SecF [Candidatus Micrarchaeota archaeon]
AAIASLLMLIGFSLDTDILLTVRILKRGMRDPRTSAYEAMKTGITMSFSAMLAFFALFVVGELTNIAIYQDISRIVLVGLFGDLIGTWLLNAVIMIYHVEKGAKSAGVVVR